MDTTLNVDSQFHIFLRKKGTYIDKFENSPYINSVSLIIDKSVKMFDVNLIRKQLRLAGYSKVYYFLKSESYEKVNFLSSRLKPISESDYKKYNSEENPIMPPPPPFLLKHFKGEILRIHIDGNKIKINDKIITINVLSEHIKSKLLPNEELGFFYYISDNSTYQNFIRFNEIVFNTIYDARDDYLMKNYKMQFRDNFNYNTDEIRESQNLFPLFLKQIDSLEYAEMKSKKILQVEKIF